MGRNLGKMKMKQATADPPPSPPRWLELPREVTADILHRLRAHDILESAQKVCTAWRNVCKDPSMWRVTDMKNLGAYDDDCLDMMCRQAVDRSQGQLTEIHIDYFVTEELLNYISERSKELRCLRLGGCNCISGFGLSEVAKKFPLLEELHFVYVKNCNYSIEAIGHSCPKLRSFTLSESKYRHPHLISNDEAIAIAKSMPGLHHLRLLGNNMTNEGLQAILDGCLLLESLDIRKCFNVDVSGDLGKRITEKIKDFKSPFDSMEDCEWDANKFDPENYFWNYILSGYSDVYSYEDYWDNHNDFQFGSYYNPHGEFEQFHNDFQFGSHYDPRGEFEQFNFNLD